MVGGSSTSPFLFLSCWWTGCALKKTAEQKRRERLALFQNYVYFTDIRAMFNAWKEMSEEDRELIKKEWSDYGNWLQANRTNE